MKHTISLLLFFLGVNLIAQTSDQIKYHLVLDNSGSVNWMDSNNNLQYLLKEMSYVNRWENRSEFQNAIVSFDLVLYGSNVKTEELDVFNITDDVIKKLNRNMTYETQRSQRKKNAFSDLLEPLNDIIQRTENRQQLLAKEGKALPAQAVIIFTDGILKSGDIREEKGIYDSLLMTTVDLLENTYNTPVYYVISNAGSAKGSDLSLLKHFFKENNTKVKKDSFLVDNKVFWLSNQVDLSNDRTDVFNALRDFQSKLNTDLVSSPQSENLKGDPIYAAYKVQELINLENELAPLIAIDDYNRIIYETLQNSPTGDSFKDLIKLIDLIKSDTLLYSETSPILEEISRAPENFDYIKSAFLKWSSDIYKNSDMEMVDIDKFIETSSIVQSSLVESYPEANSADFENASIEDTEQVKRDLESDIIIGFSDYVIERVKLESIYSLFENLREEMEELGLNAYFPLTWELLLNSENYTDFSRINNTFQRDLDAMPETLGEMDLKVNSELLVLRYTYAFIDQLILEGQYVKALSSLEEYRVFDKNLNLDDIPFDERRSFLAEDYILFSAKLISFLERADIDQILNNEQHMDEFAKLISEHALFQVLGPNSDLVLLNNERDKLLFQLRTLYKKYKGIERSIIRYKEVSSQIPDGDYLGQRQYAFDILLGIIDDSIDLLIEVNEIGDFISLGNEEMYDIAQTLRVMSDIKDFYFHVRKKEFAQAAYTAAPWIAKSLNYEPLYLDKIKWNKNLNWSLRQKSLYLKVDSSAVYNRIDALKAFLEDASDWQDKEQELIDSVQELIIGQDYSNYIDDLPQRLLEFDAVNNSYTISEEFINEFESQFTQSTLFGFEQSITRYSSNFTDIKGYVDGFIRNIDRSLIDFESNQFISSKKLEELIILGGEISQAKSSDEVKSILSKKALPVASYKLKRGRPAWMITTYAGFGANYYTNTTADQFSFAVSVPVGIEYSIPQPAFGITKSMSFMAVVFDVGNVVEYRAFNTDEEQTVEIESIFSPGFLFSLGLSNKLPLSLNLSYLTNPNRVNVGLAFDLPLFNLSGSY